VVLVLNSTFSDVVLARPQLWNWRKEVPSMDNKVFRSLVLFWLPVLSAMVANNTRSLWYALCPLPFTPTPFV
jgi:hypothetical protein